MTNILLFGGGLMADSLDVLLVQRILPPYRLRFFQRLALSPVFRLRVAYGCASKGSALESIANPPGLSTVPLCNFYLCVSGKERVVYQRGLLAQLHSGQYDMVIAEFNPRIISNMFACIYAQRSQARFIWWGHGTSPRSGSTSVGLRLWLIRLANAVIFYDAVQAERFVSLGVPRDKVFVAPNSIDTEEIDTLAQNRPRHERNRILYIGRLIPEKKVELLIRGFALAYPQLDPETKLTVIGDGPERARLEHLAEQLGLTDQVEFTGTIYQQDLLAPWFNSAWVSVSPGYIGLSAIHSIAYGIPMVVAQDELHSPEIAALKGGVNTLFFPSDDTAALAQRLLHLANDQERWRHMAQAARRTVHERFSLSAMVGVFEQAVQHVLRRDTTLT